MRNTRALRAWGALAGLLFIVLFIVGSILIFNGPDGDETPAKIADFYGDDGHRTRMNLGWIVAGLGVFFFLWFVAALRETIGEAESRAPESSGSDGSGMLRFVVTVGGTVYAAVTMVALGLGVGVRSMSDDTYQHQVYPGAIHAANDASYVMHATGTAGLAAMILAASLAILGSAILPRWLGWFGILAALAALASIAFVTMFVWLLWIGVASLLLFAYARKAPASSTATL